VLRRSTRQLEYEGSDDLPWWAPAEAHIVPAPAPYRREVRFVAPLVEMTVYLPWLRDQVRIRRRRADRLADALAEAPVVVNAAGLAAGALCGDDTVYPARGQIVLARNPGLDTSVRAEGDPSTYVHPRTADVVLGGTFEVDRWSLTPEPATSAAIVERCTALVPALREAEILGAKVGLRPCRRGGPRVEREGRVVHAYGHGGAGMTLCWGTADEVVRLAMQA
jgi:D-amino-acid oxidase